MKYFTFLLILCILQSLFLLGCINGNSKSESEYDIPKRNHDLSYIPYDENLDNSSYVICDSTKISSGRNRLQYIGGNNKLRQDIISKYLYKPEYEKFSGFIVVRFLVNCKGKSGRYRGESLHLNFSPSDAPSSLVDYSIGLIKSLDNWEKSAKHDIKNEYSKYINIKIKDGKIEHILL